MKNIFKFIGMAMAFVVAYVAVKEIKQYLVNEIAEWKFWDEPLERSEQDL